jgi:hypothetical protein
MKDCRLGRPRSGQDAKARESESLGENSAEKERFGGLFMEWLKEDQRRGFKYDSKVSGYSKPMIFLRSIPWRS